MRHLVRFIVQFPHLIGDCKVEYHLRDRLFCGMVKPLRDSIHCMYNEPTINYVYLMVAAHNVDTEVIDKGNTTTTQGWVS